MRELDLSTNPRIPILMETVRSLSSASSASEATGTFLAGMRRAYGSRLLVTLQTHGLDAGSYRVSRLVDKAGTDHVEGGTSWFGAPDQPVRRGGFLGRVCASPEPKVFVDLEVLADPVLGDLAAEARSAAAAPVFSSGSLLGWMIAFDEDPARYGERDIEEMVIRANMMGMLVENVRLARRLRDADLQIRHEVDQIAGIQRALLPRNLPHIPGLEATASFETFDRAGGDIYDVLPLQRGPDGMRSVLDGRWAILIADASGHGPSAAVVAAIIQTLLHAFPGEPEGPAQLLEFLHRHLYEKQLDLTFVTAFLAIYDPASRTLRYANAGHNPPLLKRRREPCRRLDEVGSPPLGVLPEMDIDESDLELADDDMLLLYTDGITETFDSRGSYFGTEGIERAMDACTEDTASCVINHIRSAILDYEGGRRPSDDQTLLAFRVVGKDAAYLKRSDL